MAFAFDEAVKAFEADEVPVGAVLVDPSRGRFADHNRTRELKSPSAHAESLVIGAACGERGDWRLEDCTLYTTLEPCLMCAGLAVIARIPRIVFGARDMRFGAFGSVTDVLDMPGLNHYPEVVADFMPELSADLLKEFFRKHR
jgi:tRNA(adenine34) deaminase